jgi:tagatose 1,6-diphosphate aldolase
MASPEVNALPSPGGTFKWGDVALRLDRILPGDPSRDYVPYYHFRIETADGTDVGHINFRVGDTPHIHSFAGHIGFEIREAFRGHGYARQACLAIAPLVRTRYVTIFLTCDPDNVASKRTIERLGATLLDEVPTPAPNANLKPRAKSKLRYAWNL